MYVCSLVVLWKFFEVFVVFFEKWVVFFVGFGGVVVELCGFVGEDLLVDYVVVG